MISSLVLFFSNARYSIEFTGGITLQIAGQLPAEQVVTDLTNILEAQDIPNPEVSIQNNISDSIITIKTNIQDDLQIEQLTENVINSLITSNYISGEQQIIQQAVVGPSVGEYMQNAAIRALIIGIILMVIYMLFSFASIRKYISPAILGWVTVATMVFDILVPAGAYGLLMMINPSLQIDTIFIIAILTTIWYSINDTIIIFDRIRENMSNISDQKNIIIGKIFEDSIRQTMRRSIGTSLSTLLVIACMYIFGTGVIKQFAFTMGMGVISGSFSSIFIAAPLAYIMLGRFKKEKNKI